jgi:nucleotide-binding universal stress UspA family protein
VVGARGLGTLERILLGSVSEGVLRHVDRPVLIVKTAAS